MSPALRVTASPAWGWCAGLRHPPEAEYPAGFFTAGQMAQMQADPALTLEPVETLEELAARIEARAKAEAAALAEAEAAAAAAQAEAEASAAAARAEAEAAAAEAQAKAQADAAAAARPTRATTKRGA